MYKLLFVLFIIDLYARVNNFKRLKKHGQDIYKLSKTLENQISKHRKIQLDISFIKQCKKENIIPTFAKVNIAIRHGTYKLKKKIAHTVMVTELQNKHHERRKLKKDIIKTTSKLKSSLSFIMYSTLLHQMNIAVKGKSRAITFRHKKKLLNLRKKQKQHQQHDTLPLYVCNMSSYVLSDEEQLALSFGLDQHVPVKCDNNLINTEFEHYFQNIKNTVPNISDDKMLQLKTKLLSTCEKYNNVKVPFKHRQVIKRLAENKNIMLLRQDKGKGVVIMDKGNYTGKCVNLLNSNQFNKLSHNPTLWKSVENKIKRALRKIKTKFSKQDYVKSNRLSSYKVSWYSQKP